MWRGVIAESVSSPFLSAVCTVICSLYSIFERDILIWSTDWKQREDERGF
jgi:hypothetical protein